MYNKIEQDLKIYLNLGETCSPEVLQPSSYHSIQHQTRALCTGSDPQLHHLFWGHPDIKYACSAIENNFKAFKLSQVVNINNSFINISYKSTFLN